MSDEFHAATSVSSLPMFDPTVTRPEGPNTGVLFIEKYLYYYIIILILSIIICLYNINNSGTLWPDGPRYANAGAMIRDWVLSGELLRPYKFAVENYHQYPAFSIPYHPPGHPGLLGLFFLAFGSSYLSARVAMALCLGGAACIFFALLKRLEVGSRTAFACALLLLTTPEIARWSRDTMSEIPALMFILGGSYVFLAWLDTGRPLHCLMAFVLAEVAFLNRITTSGLLPAWFLYAVLSGRSRRLASWTLAMASITYLGLNVTYIEIAARFAKHEVAADGRGNGLSWSNLAYFSTSLPPTLMWGSSLVAGVALIWAAKSRCEGRRTLVGFWLSWGLSYGLFKLFVPTSHELRHFFMAWPALPGLAACLDRPGASYRLRQWLVSGVFGLGLLMNLLHLGHLPRGVVGYEGVARRIAEMERPGNVLMACWHDQDLIFRYRCNNPKVRRNLIRGDRTLAIRLAGYANVGPKILARSKEDVLDVIHRGRVRYLVTCLPGSPPVTEYPEEMSLAHTVARDSPEAFSLVGVFSLRIMFGRRERFGWVFVWEYLKELPDHPSELPILIPTAEMRL